MLESLRKMTGGITAKILIGLLVVSFAIWGASSAFVGGGGSNTIVVGDTKVGLNQYRLAYLNRVNSLSQQFGQRLSREQARALGVDRAVLGQLVAGAVLDENARKMGLGLSEDNLAAQIGDDPAFKDQSGNFSRQRLEFALREAGMRESDYIETRTAELIREQLVSALSRGLEMPDAFFKFAEDYQSQKRVFEYVTITRDAVGEVGGPEPSDVEKFYEANKSSYVAPEYRKLVILKLTAEDIAKPDELSPDEVAAEYEKIKDRFATPEMRQVQQLTFADTEAAEAASKRLKDGLLFETLLTEMGRTPADIDLGKLSKSQIPDQTIAEAAFALPLNTPSDVVIGLFGPVILRVTEIEAENVKPLAEVEPEIRKTLALEKAADELYDIHDRIEDERAAGNNLAEAAGKVGLTARTIDNVDRQGNGLDGTAISDLPEADSLLNEAFETDEGVEADPVSIGTTGFVWYEVAGVTAERQRPLDEVRDQVITAWKEAETANKIRDLAQTIRDRTAKGEPFGEVVAELLPADAAGNPATIEIGAQMTRSDTGKDLSAGAVAAGFSIPEGDVTTAAGAQEPDQVVIRVEEVIDGDGSAPSDDMKNRFNSQLTDSVLGSVVSELQEREDVAIYQQAIDTAINY